MAGIQLRRLRTVTDSAGIVRLLSYQVSQRTREMGLRLALGATRANLLRSIMHRGLLLTVTGLAIGTAGSLALPRLVGGILGDVLYTGGAPVSAVLSGNGVALLISTGLLFVSAMFASYLPARRAANVEPMEALRANELSRPRLPLLCSSRHG